MTDLRAKIAKIVEETHKVEYWDGVNKHNIKAVKEGIVNRIMGEVGLLQTQLEKIDELKVIEPPAEVEDLSSKRVAFMTGQMNVFARILQIMEDDGFDGCQICNKNKKLNSDGICAECS